MSSWAGLRRAERLKLWIQRHAGFIFPKDMWVLEHAEINAAPEGQRLLEIGAFAELAEHFL